MGCAHRAPSHAPTDAKCRAPDNPGGSLILTVAENKLSSDMLQARMQQVQGLLPLEVFSYGDVTGRAGALWLARAIVIVGAGGMQRTHRLG